MTDLQLALEEAAWEREEAQPLDSYEVALCIEADDFTPPRGRVLGSDVVVAFPGSAYGKVREGSVYFVPRSPYGEVTAYPFALLPGWMAKIVARFRLSPRYGDKPPWIEAGDTLENWL